MIERKWNDNWKFFKDKDAFALAWEIPESAKSVTLPHDALIEEKANPNSANSGNTGFRDGEVYTYVKKFYVSEEDKRKILMVKFEGVYMNVFVYINGQLAAKNPFGYTTFYAALNDYLKYGQDNEIRVQVRTGVMNSRWYSGAGIYRDVYFMEAEKIYIEPEGCQIKTENADEETASVKVSTQVYNKTTDLQGILLETVIKDENGILKGNECTEISLFGLEKRKIAQRFAISNPGLWSAENPELYTCEVTMYRKTEDENRNTCWKKIDTTSEKFGIRTISVDAKRGLRINGKETKLRGGCIHHDSGLLGTATYEDAQYRQIRKMKKAGFNAIRMSHHPMAPAMLRACDELGMYVMDECFDMWNRMKSNYDYGLYFQEWWEKDVTAMVKKDYNHPSVILYSVGNEIPEIGTDKGAQTCYMISERVHMLDDTRYTLASINGVFAAGDKVDQIVEEIVADLKTEGKIEGNVNDFMTLMDGHMDKFVTHDIISKNMEKACAGVDIAGYNYMTARYEMDGEKYQNRVIVGSETYPPEIAKNWNLVEKLPYLIGDFTWTGWDYIGEAGVGIPAYTFGEGGFGAVFPAQLAYVGDFDITGYRRPASYYRELVFGCTQKPYIAVQPPIHFEEKLLKTPWIISDATANWTWNGWEGKKIVVEVYSSGEEVELLLNGKQIDKKKVGEETPYRTLFELTYEPGVLKAVSYKNEKVVGSTELKTAKESRKLVLKEESYVGLKGKEQELVYVQIEMQDEEGILVTEEPQKITFTVDEKAEVLGFGSGDPKPDYNYNENITNLYKGRAQVILRKPKEKIRLTVNSESGLEESIVIG